MSGLHKLSVVGISVLLLLSSTAKGQQRKEGRTYWIERYLSVSYPLNTIEVTSPFGTRKDPFTGEHVSHSGLDLRADHEQVMAMFDGSVERIGIGKSIVIESDGPFFCHVGMLGAIESTPIVVVGFSKAVLRRFHDVVRAVIKLHDGLLKLYS